MVHVTLITIVAVLASAVYRNNSELSIFVLLVLVFYSRWETTSEVILRIAQFAMIWDRSKGKFQMKIARDLKSGRPLPASKINTQAFIEAELAEPKALPVASYLTEDQIFEVVRKLPDVASFILRMKKPISLIEGPKPLQVGDQERPAYIVQIAEDRGEHLATYDWIHLDARTGAVLDRMNGDQLLKQSDERES